MKNAIKEIKKHFEWHNNKLLACVQNKDCDNQYICKIKDEDKKIIWIFVTTYVYVSEEFFSNNRKIFIKELKKYNLLYNNAVY